MTDGTNNKTVLVPPHGGYKKLLSYQTTVIIYDFTVAFCEKYIDRFSRTRDQMTQAARSGKQNIVEGSQASGTSKKTEIKLMGVARASLAELLEDFEDFLRQHELALWGANDPRVRAVRELAYKTDRTYETYRTYMNEAEAAANCAICLIHQANYLLDRQIAVLEQAFLEEGGFTERLYRARKERRGKPWDKASGW